MLDELIGFVGLSSSTGVEAESGLYVDALPDISVSIVDRLVQDGTANDEWSKIEKRTLLKFRTLFVAEVNKCHKVSDLSICECLIVSNKLLIATALWYLLGAEVMMTRSASSRINAATIDRNKSKELRDYFENQFEKELTVAVNSIDVHSSDCFPEDEEPECTPLIKTVYPSF